jgi:hypothetical protein
VRKFFSTVVGSLMYLTLSAGDDFCGIRNTAFAPNEVLTLNVFYNVIGLYINAGTASFTTTLERIQ